MPTNKPVIYHKLPLTVTFGPGEHIDLTGDIPGVMISNTATGLKLTLPAPLPANVEHQYYYTIAAPKADQAEVHYLAVFSGPARESMAIWAQENGASRSPNFSLSSGQHSMAVSFVVVSMPLGAGPQINSQNTTSTTAPRVRANTRNVKSQCQGGGGEDR